MAMDTTKLTEAPNNNGTFLVPTTSGNGDNTKAVLWQH
jgi:hypothetical protein